MPEVIGFLRRWLRGKGSAVQRAWTLLLLAVLVATGGYITSGWLSTLLLIASGGLAARAAIRLWTQL